jgi:hypothetical protein
MPESGKEIEPRRPEEVQEDVATELRRLREKINRLAAESRGQLPGIETK